MSGMKRVISRREPLSALATFALVVAIVVAVPGISTARAAVKQFLASMSPTTASGNAAGSWTETVTNCGSASTAPCTASSTIGLGTIRIAVPTEFRPITSPTAATPEGQPVRNWTVSYDSGTGNINAFATSGADKLQPGESVLISFNSTPSTCAPGTKTFTTSAWGSTPTPGSDPFTIQTAQPTIQITGCQLGPDQNVTGPNGTNVTNDSDVTVNVSFGGTLSCSSDETRGAQWDTYHLPDEVNITPPDGLNPEGAPKAFTFRFTGTADSSFYLICYSSADSGAGTILDPCYPGGGAALIAPPCVDKQYRDILTNKVTITIRTPPADPRAH
jgi:hypothetical protein